jgi:AIPR protein
MSLSRRARCASFLFNYHVCRTISGPEDVAAGRKILVGQAPATSFLELADNENVREYLVAAKGKQKQSPTLVHQAIRTTLKDHPEDFSVLNGGICIVAHEAETDDQKRILTLTNASIINGSQTQGELRRFFEKPTHDCVPSVKFEIIVTSDDGLVADVSIARNFQNDVRPISIAGRKGQLDELEQAVQQVLPSAKLRKTETDLSDEYIDTEKLIQVLFALSPAAIWDAVDETESLKNKAFAYSQKTRCLKNFQRMVPPLTEEKDERSDTYTALYSFFLDIAGEGWTLYRSWKTHQGFSGTGIRSIERDDRGRITDVPDGIVFPIVAAYSAFMRQEKKKWILDIPFGFEPKILINAAKDDYQEIAKSNPQTMGKIKACYSRLYQLTSIFADLRRQ